MTAREPDRAPDSRGAVRNLNPERERAILDAVLELLSEVGYDRMSIDQVARRARASKATIYRRWSGKAEMVAAAMHGLTVEHRPLPDTGTLRGDLAAGLPVFCRIYERKHAIVLGLLPAIRDDPELGRLLHGHMLRSGADEAAELLDRARARGEVGPGARVTTLVEVTKALLWHRLLLTGEPLDEDFVARTVDEVLLPLLQTGVT
ncbi:putative regulatory protein, TetR family [Planomonospora parontospora subsp. parontospora]|uniref:Regulatory protein, TetR family n=2 Tax=Planomonospora parontospora TaxID=58119 RepID=A0AA37F7Y1_9ACTN|nr:TetR/AcrR family transcriptional regulator [Planomonospora parontospora]GGK93675.1 putative regulatory protein, TetR family [Planomonospora parontospora]GII12381.1 putative regulatory protein, TetR family [Planomonospora parontospora subsp. parontospora]